LLFACEPEPLPVSGVPIPEKTVVIGSQNLTDEFMVISVTESFDALSGGPRTSYDELIQSLLIDGLDITVQTDGDLYDLEPSPLPGIYLGSDVPEVPGSDYTLSFQNPFNQQLVEATATLQEFVGFDSVNISIDANEFDTLVSVGLKFADPVGPNWYMVNVQLINEDFDLNINPFTELVTDEGMDGDTIDYEFLVFFRDYAEGDTVLVSMANISKDYYDFLDLRTTRRPFSGSLGEPINYPTNVQNGLGYFHMHIPDVRIFLPGLFGEFQN
ncbi:MAG: DUF4249 family protein, partial [Ekhidna sp.]|nr:DUF4249 family protein [Ekhidna sp.]